MESSETTVIAIPVISVRGEYYVSHHFGRAPYYAIVELGRSGYRRIENTGKPFTKPCSRTWKRRGFTHRKTLRAIYTQKGFQRSSIGDRAWCIL